MKLITGGAGFIGSAICWQLNKLGIDEIIIVDTDQNGTKKNNLDNLKFKDFIDHKTFLDNINSGKQKNYFDTVYHMGACSSTTENNMEYLMENNVEYSKSLGKWCLSNGVKYIYASSGATYGNGELSFDDDVSLIPKLKPLNKYGLSKQLFDLWVIENKLDKKFVGLKYFNVFGPNENHKADMRSMVNKAFHQINSTGKIKFFKSLKPEYKDGEQMRDFIYVKDAVEMTYFFDAESKGKDATGIYNIGSGTAATWLQLADAIFKALDKKPEIEFIDMPDNIKEQYQYFSKANIEKLKSAGYDSEIMSLENAVEDYVKNYLLVDGYLTP